VSERFDLYAPIHKALRNYMGAALLQLGRLDLSDASEVRRCSEALLGLVDWLEQHLHIEEHFLHTPLAERCSDALLGRLRRDHDEHERAFALLRADAMALVTSQHDPLEARRARTRHLYLALSRFVAENFLHMAVEETEGNQLLWQAFSDQELLGIYRSIIESERPEQLRLTIGWLLPAIPPEDRAKLVSGARASMSPALFDQLTQQVREVLTERDYDKLAAALGLPSAA